MPGACVALSVEGYKATLVQVKLHASWLTAFREPDKNLAYGFSWGLAIIPHPLFR